MTIEEALRRERLRALRLEPPVTVPSGTPLGQGLRAMREAGGAVSDMHGVPHNVNASDHLLADNGTLHEPVLTLFGEIFQGHFRVPIPQIG